MITRLAHICLQVKDMQRTVAFYRDGLGFPVTFIFNLAINGLISAPVSAES